MRNPARFLSLLAICSVLAACNDTPPPIPSPEPVDAALPPVAASDAKPADAWDFSNAPVDGTRMAVSPNPADFCVEKLRVVDVEWDLGAAGARTPQVWVQEPNGKRQLWAALKEPTGGKPTGKWVRSGTQFIAIDRSTMEVINSVTVEAAPCP